MNTRHLKSFLAAGVIGATGSLAIAQMDADLDADANVDVRTDRQEMRSDRERLTRTDRSEMRQTLTGTVVSLDRYLKEGRQAAEQTTAASASHSRVKALLADDGEVYIILGTRDSARPVDRERVSSNWQNDRSGLSTRSSASGSVTAGGDMEMSGRASADPDAEPTLLETPGYEIGDEVDSSATARIDRDSDARVRIDRDANAEADLYAMPDPDRKRQNRGDKLTLGEKMQATAVVHERDGIRGITVLSAKPAMDDRE